MYNNATGKEIGRCSFDERSYLVPVLAPGDSVIYSREVVCLALEGGGNLLVVWATAP